MCCAVYHAVCIVCHAVCAVCAAGGGGCGAACSSGGSVTLQLHARGVRRPSGQVRGAEGRGHTHTVRGTKQEQVDLDCLH